MVRYLSGEWLSALQRAVDERAPVPSGPTAEPDRDRLTVQQVVTGGPDGDVSYHVTVAEEEVRIEPGRSTEPTVTFTQSYATAAAVARGELSAQEAFMLGLIRVGGDLPELVQRHDTFARLDDVFASVRAETEY